MCASRCCRPAAFSWPWESLHYEALAWYDHWLKGRETGIMEGPPIRYVLPGAPGWRTAETWPPPESRLMAFALRADGALAGDEGVAWVAILPAHARRFGPAGAPKSARTAILADMGDGAMAADFDFAGNIELDLDATSRRSIRAGSPCFMTFRPRESRGHHRRLAARRAVARR